jgi:multicomponent Na+:H+ antiporter subunit D
LTALLPVLLLLTSLVPAAITFFLAQDSHRLRNALSLGGAVLKVSLIVAMLFAVAGGASMKRKCHWPPG